MQQQPQVDPDAATLHGLVSSPDPISKKRNVHHLDVGLGVLADKVHSQVLGTQSKNDLNVSNPGSASSPGGIADEKAEKKQKRLAKNREAAQMFRQRQKVYIQDLEKRTGDLTAENASLRAKVDLLSAENKVIRDQLAYLRSVIGNAVQINMDKVPTAGGKPTARDEQDNPGGPQ